MRTRLVKPDIGIKRHLLIWFLGALALSLTGCFGLLGSGMGPLPPGAGNEHRTVIRGVVVYDLHSPVETAAISSGRDAAKHAATPSYPTQPFAYLAASDGSKLIVHLAAVQPSDTVPPSVQALLAELGGSVDRWIGALNSLVIQLPAGTDLHQAAARFERLPEVRLAEPSQTVYPLQVATLTPNDPDWPSQWHLRYIHMPKAWAIETGNSDVIIAVIDTGYSTHPDLPQEGDPRLVHPYSVFEDSPSYFDDGSGHGAAVAGVAAATTHNQAYGAGVGWRVSVMPIRVLRKNSAGQEIGDEADVASAIVWAVDHGAHVINLSFGIPGESRVSTIMRQAINYALERGVTVVAAAGNDGNNYEVVSPASHPGVIAVGAVTQQGLPAPFSNSGNRSGGNSLDVVAPGTAIYTTSTQLSGTAAFHRTAPFNGTSFAAPQVSGVVALLYARGVLSRSMGSAAPALAQSILRETAVPLEPGRAYDDAWGYGLVDAYAALTWDTRPRLSEVHVFAAHVDSGQLHVVGDVVHPNRYGEFQLINIPPGRQTLFAWADVDRNGRINPGDYVARLDNVLIAADNVITGLHFHLRETDLHFEVIR